jgi:YkoY family integral membrane protein
MMNFINGLLNNYAQFFSWENIVSVIIDPKSWFIILTLVILEGLLSSDNAIVLAIMVKHLPEEKQKKALFYGLWGAYLFRFLAIGLGTYLVEIWWIKILGGLYLMWLAIKYFLDKYNPKDENHDGIADHLQKGFWATVATVELMDIAFSIDNVLASFGVSEKVWVIFLGSILGIFMMRWAANVFLKLIKRVPELETTAYILIAIIGLKMLVESAGIHIDELLFFGVIVIVFASTFVVHKMKKESNTVQA